jgi:hypothetical protein
MNKRIIKVKMPGMSLLNKSGINYDYADSFQTICGSDINTNSTDIAKAFYAYMLNGPFLFKLLINPSGLTTKING